MFQLDSVQAQLQMHRRTSQEQMGARGGFIRNGAMKLPVETFFYFFIKENAAPERILEIKETVEASIMLTFISDEAETLIRFVQRVGDRDGENRCTIYDIRGDQMKQVDGESFSQMVSENPEYFEKRWTPLMKKLGIQFVTEKNGD